MSEKEITYMTECFYCGNHKGDIVVKESEDDIQLDPQYMYITDYEPCQNCTHMVENGVVFMEVVDEMLLGRPELFDTGTYPTGRYVILTPSFANANTEGDEPYEPATVVPLTPEQFDAMFVENEGMVD